MDKLVGKVMIEVESKLVVELMVEVMNKLVVRVDGRGGE